MRSRIGVMPDMPPDGSAARILFLYSDTGGGHRAAAQAIDHALRALPEASPSAIETHHVDAVAAGVVSPLREGVASYGTMLKVQPSPYPAIYHLTNGRTRFRVISELGMPFIRRSFRRMLAATRPDVVVSVHPLLNSFARRLIQAMRLDSTLVTVITDLVTIHHSWTSDAAADEYVVPSPEARALCIERGIAARRVHDFGLPIRDGFSPPHDPAAAKAALGFDPHRPLLVVMGGGEGGGRLKRLMSDVAPTIRALNLCIAVITGRNDVLRRRLARTAADFGDGACVVGFVENVADYMRAADLLLTKAGPGTIVEAAAVGLPVLLYEFISGQERGNLEYVTSRGAGVVALDSASVSGALERLFAHGSAELTGMRAKALRSARPRAAHDIARFLVELLERRSVAKTPAHRANP